MNLSSKLVDAFSPDFIVEVTSLSKTLPADKLMSQIQAVLTLHGYEYISNEAGTVFFTKDTKLK